MSDCSSSNGLKSEFRLLSNAAAVEANRQGVFTVYLFVVSSLEIWSTSMATKSGSSKRENAGITLSVRYHLCVQLWYSGAKTNLSHSSKILPVCRYTKSDNPSQIILLFRGVSLYLLYFCETYHRSTVVSGRPLEVFRILEIIFRVHMLPTYWYFGFQMQSSNSLTRKEMEWDVIDIVGSSYISIEMWFAKLMGISMGCWISCATLRLL